MDSVALMLIPDRTYIAARPKTKDHHLTVAFYGAASTMSPENQSSLRRLVTRIADGFQPIKAKANGIGMFANGTEGTALVDLIDGVGVQYVRQVADGWVGPNIDTRHGFTPHMTREYLEPEDDFYATISADMIDGVQFTFSAIGLWFADQRYEVAL